MDAQLIRLASFAALVVSCLGTLHLTGLVDLGRYLGSSFPLAAAVLIGFAGVASLRYLQRAEGLEVVSSSARVPGLRLAVLLVMPFVVGITVIDLLRPFPADLNVPLPAALVFYPAIGFLAQMALHVIPFALLIGVGRFIAGGKVANWWIWTALLIASSFEAVFQVMAALQGSLLVICYVAISLFLFGVVELVLYRRFDYLTMYVFRLLYYLYWHIGWGSARLVLLPFEANG